MKSRHIWLLLFWLAAPAASPGIAPSTAFTYQGRLLDGGQPANGAYDLQFALSSAPVCWSTHTLPLTEDTGSTIPLVPESVRPASRLSFESACKKTGLSTLTESFR